MFPNSGDEALAPAPEHAEYSSTLLTRPGAVEACGDDAHPARASVAWHYGDPLTEQAAAERGPVIVDRSNHGVVEVTGSDAATFLNTLLSQKVDNVPLGWYGQALSLDMNGRIQHSMWIKRCRLVSGAEGFLVSTSRPTLPALFAHLQRSIFWSDVALNQTHYRLLSLFGSGHEHVAAELATRFSESDGVFFPTVTRGVPRVDILCPQGFFEPLVDAACSSGSRLVGLMAWDAHRVCHVDAAAELDCDAATIPHEVDAWINRDSYAAVHLEKGCYCGQETVARVENLGSAPRALVKVQLDGSAPSLPKTGDSIMRAGDLGGRRPRSVGRIGTVVHDCNEGPVALALVRRKLCVPGALPGDLVCGDCAVAIDPDTLPAPEEPKLGREAIARWSGKK